jgi:hypothetical protein
MRDDYFHKSVDFATILGDSVTEANEEKTNEKKCRELPPLWIPGVSDITKLAL